ncbi:hypothetical protein F5B21DRAFT_219307 [Xylaria acuta]|nr:hypothetical protein F5B21DRAFT_219307 [Xylaria acuta]
MRLSGSAATVQSPIARLLTYLLTCRIRYFLALCPSAYLYTTTTTIVSIQGRLKRHDARRIRGRISASIHIYLPIRLYFFPFHLFSFFPARKGGKCTIDSTPKRRESVKSFCYLKSKAGRGGDLAGRFVSGRHQPKKNRKKM